MTGSVMKIFIYWHYFCNIIAWVDHLCTWKFLSYIAFKKWIVNSRKLEYFAFLSYMTTKCSWEVFWSVYVRDSSCVAQHLVYVHSRGHILGSVIMRYGQNVCPKKNRTCLHMDQKHGHWFDQGHLSKSCEPLGGHILAQSL